MPRIRSGVEISEGVLYRARISIPSQVPVGTYTAETFLIDDGKVIAAATRDIEIGKIGFERFVALAARRHGFLYGLAAVHPVAWARLGRRDGLPPPLLSPKANFNRSRLLRLPLSTLTRVRAESMDEQPNLQQFPRRDQQLQRRRKRARNGALAGGRPSVRSARSWKSPARARKSAWTAPCSQLCQAHADPSVAMSGQVGSQVKMMVGSSWLIANVRTMRSRRQRRRSSPTIDFLGEGAARFARAACRNFRRGVTRYPIPGDKVLPVTHRGPARDLRRRRRPAHRNRHRLSDRRHPRRALRRPDAVEAFRGPGIDRYR